MSNTFSSSEKKLSTGGVRPENGLRPEKKRGWLYRFWQAIRIPFLAIFSGLLLGAIFIAVTSTPVYMAFRNGFGLGMRAVFATIGDAYSALFQGAFGDPGKIVEAIRNGEKVSRAFKPIFQSLVETTPYLFTGLALALGFRAGVFNIGGEGQIYIGAVLATLVGTTDLGLPPALHMTAAILLGVIGGAVWGFVPGWLKANAGSHEVINTIMMNYIALRLVEFLLTGPMTKTGSGGMPTSNGILESARIPLVFARPLTLHWGFFLSIVIAILAWFLLFKTKWGFNLQIAGANKHAAKYAGLNVKVWMVLGMTLSGALAGLCGAVQVLGVTYSMGLGVSAGYGFDAISLALLANNNPLACIPAAFLFGFMKNGSRAMMSRTGIPIDIVSIIQAFILVFIAAPAIIRTIYRLRGDSKTDSKAVSVSGFGGN